jgi:hypothetical protein
MSEDDIKRAIERDILPSIRQPAPAEPQEKGSPLVGGALRLGSTIQTGIESLFDAEGAARRGLARSEELAKKYGSATDLEAVKQAYAERGLLPAAGEVISQVPGAVAEQVPQIGATLASARLGAMAGAPFGPLGAVIGGVGGAALPSLAQLFGSNIQRQAEEGQPISRTKAAAAAVPGAALETASTFIPLGRTLVGKLLGPQAEQLLARGGSKVVDDGLAKVLTKGAAVGAAVEVPTEVTQQMLERLQAGLSLTSPDALAEYGEAAYGAGLVGGPFGAVGRVGQRYAARGEREKEAADQRRLDAEIAAKEQEAAAAEEEARKQTPEYRQELNAKLVGLRDELAQVEPIAKDKTLDEDVRKEAVSRANEIKKELKSTQEEMKASMQTAGVAPTLESELAKRKAAPAPQQVVDEFGNIVKPKKAAMTEEEYAEGYDREAARMQERNELLRKLREKEEAEAEAKRQKTYEETQRGVQTYLSQLQDIQDVDFAETAKRVAAQQQRREEDVAQEMTLERIQMVLDNFGLRAAGVDPEVRKAVEDKINEGVIDRTVTKVLGIRGLEGRTYRGEDAVQALPNIKEVAAKFEEERQKATASAKELMDDKGQLTPAGYKLVANEAKLNELKRLINVIEGRVPAETSGEAMAAGTIEAAGQAAAEPTAVDIEPGKPSGVYRQKAKEANQTATGSFTDIISLMDDYRQARFFGEAASPEQRKLASSTREGLIQQSEELRKNVVDNLIQEVAYERQAQSLRPFTRDEAIGLGIKADEVLQEIINRSTALPRGAALKEVVLEPAQVRGTEIIKSAKTALRDTRPLAQRQFGNQRRAIEVLAEMLKQYKEEAVQSGKRAVRAGEKPLLKKQYAAAPTDLVKDLDRVLRMENLQPEVKDTLEQARRRLEEGGASVGLEELVEEQVGRILRGTDRPFVLERDVTKPGGRRAMAAAGNAELIDEIQTQMRFDSEQAQFAATEQADLFPETVATERATPGMFQRLQKSKKVQAEKEKIAGKAQRLETIKQAAKKVERERLITPEKIALKEKQIMDQIAKVAQDFRKDPEDMVSTKVSAQWAALDEDIKNQVGELKGMKAKLAKMPTETVEHKVARAAIARQEKLIEKVKERYAKEDAARKKLIERAQSGLGLPGVRAEVVPAVTTRRKTKEEYEAEMKEYRQVPAKLRPYIPKPTKYEVGTARRVKIVPIKSKVELDEEAAARRQEQLSDIRRKTKVASPETIYNKLKEEEKAAVELAKIKTKALNDFVKLVNEGKAPKNFPKFKKMSAEVDMAKANVRSIRDNLRLLAETQYDPEQVKRQPSRGPIGGPVKFYDKKFTTDQLNQMANLGVGAFTGTKSYSVDDIIDFRIGEGASRGIDLEQANKRMADVEQKAKSAGIKFKYFPTMKEVTVDILKDMERQGVDIYETSIRGGVKPDGTVFVIGENHTDMTDLEKTIAHEFVGHYSFEGMLGPDGMTDLMVKADKSFATKDNENGLEVLAKDLGVYDEYRDAVVSAARFYEQDLADGKITEREVLRIAKTKGLREIIAYTMEKRVDQNFMQKAKRWIQELVGAARAALKKFGLGDAAKLSTSDLFYMMKQANQTFEEGKPIAYKNSEGGVDFRAAKTKYNAGMEDLGAIADKVVGSQKGFVDGIKANVMGLAGRVQFVDRWAALEELVKKGVEKGIIDSLKAADVMYFARMADQRHAFTAEVASNGNLKLKEVKRPDGKIEKIVESERGANLKDISDALRDANVGDAEATGRLFTLYLAAERASKVGLDKLNYSGKVTQADLNKALAMGRANPAFQKARTLYNEYNKGLIEFAVKTGAMSKDLGARLMARGDYIPFYRIKNGVAELLIGGEKAIQIGNVKSQPYLQELIGGDEAIADFFTSSLQNTALLTDMALRNMATYQAANAMQDLGVTKIIKGDGPAGKDIIRFKYNGENYFAQIDTEAKQDLFGDIPTELIVTGMEGIKVVVPGIVRGLAGPANILRKFVTRDPRYAVRQVFRDSLTASLTTGSNMKPVVDTMGQIKKMYTEGAGALQRRGVVGGQVITGAPEDMAKIIQQISSGKPGWDLAMAKLDQFAMAGDAATRMALYNSFLKQGLSEREATIATLESMNFGRRGVSPSIYFLNATIPFFNAGIQGLDVLYRAYNNKMPYAEQLKVKQKMIARGLMLTGFTLAYAAMMQDDEAYKNATPEQRYGNWFIRIPGVKEPFRVPIPFELGLIFKAVPEGVFNAAFSDEKGSKVAADLTKQLMRSLPGNPAEVGVPVPTFMKPFIETALNKSFFTGRDIVDARLQGLDKQFQYRDKTPEVLKALGPVFEMMGLAPVQVENIIRGVTGSLGVGLMSIVDPVLKSGEAGGVAAKGPSEIPLVGGLFQPNDAGRVIDNAYDSVKEIQARQGSYKKLIEEGEFDAAQEYLKKNLPDISMASFAGSFRQQMGQITKAERAIKAAPEKVMSPDEKRKQLDDLRKIKITLSKQFTDVREQIGRQAAR